ncbi:GDP-mannose mannosyl hydrolase [Oceanimonas marisflavi]|uniref:GDP-mannose mannosyl hydrolase n=1 Tax=Oceanimonas marisflavi TaxID=2059724 RepID=UPI000D2F7AEF|nr:GDP-mannose mannosyl hydrolase [Oceanimonas marisflavi]
MWLDTNTFKTVVASTPLVSIDLVVENEQGEILLGKRLNRPAQGLWFVPGGRIQKNETLDAAFIRLTTEELGLPLERSHARLLDVYEHFYNDSVFEPGPDAPSTHYVVLGYHIVLPAGQSFAPPAAQHGEYQWWPVEAMQTSNKVHANTRAYLGALR